MNRVVTGCNDCPLAIFSDALQGKCCVHPDGEGPLDWSLDGPRDTIDTPEWCPLKKESWTLTFGKRSPMQKLRVIDTIEEMTSFLAGFNHKFEHFEYDEKPLIAIHVYWGDHYIEEYNGIFCVEIEGEYTIRSLHECEKALEDWFILNADLIGYPTTNKE